MSGSVRLNAESWDNIDGADTKLAAMPTVPTKNTNLRGGKRVDLLLGLSWQTKGHHQGHRLALEIGTPIYQNLNGPQLETDWVLTLGWEKTY